MKTTITLELLKRVHKEVSPELKKAIELEVPEVKGRLEVGRWYIRIHNKKCIINYQGKDYLNYGFGACGDYSIGWTLNEFNRDNFRLATTKEVETAIKNECIRLGIWDNPNVICLRSGEKNNVRLNEDFCIHDNVYWSRYCLMFENGKFATPITEPTEKELLIEKLNELKEKATELETQINQMKCETK